MGFIYALISRWAYARQQGKPWALAFHRPWPTTRRGLCLWFLSLAVAMIGGVNYVTTTVPERTVTSLWFPLSITGGDPVPWGVLMIAVGALGMFASYCHFGRDKIGYVLIAMMTTGWGFCYLVGPLQGGGLRSVGGAVIWFVFAAIAVTVAGFPNVRLGRPPPTLAPDSTGGDDQ